MLVHITELLSEEHASREEQVFLENSSFSLSHQTINILESKPFILKLTHLGKKVIRVVGHAIVVLEQFCDRCTERVETKIEMDIDVEIDFNKSSTDRINDLDEQRFVLGYDLDIDCLIFEELLIHLPDKVLCKEDCKGICKVCNANKNQTNCSCIESNQDLQMSKILDIFKEFKEV